jgi:hypothetical protein
LTSSITDRNTDKRAEHITKFEGKILKDTYWTVQNLGGNSLKTVLQSWRKLFREEGKEVEAKSAEETSGRK